MTTPKQITHKLTRYADKHPESHLAIYEIPQIPGYRHPSGRNKGISESLITTGYVLPITILNPYLAGGLFMDYVLRGRYKLIPKDTQKLTPQDLDTLTLSTEVAENPLSAREQVHSVAAASDKAEFPAPSANSGLKEIMATHEQVAEPQKPRAF